jgi:hypothetical protein
MRKHVAIRWLVLYLASMLLLNTSLAWYLRKEIASGYGDFAIFYTAARILAEEQAPQLYDSVVQFEKQQQFAPTVEGRQHGALPYNHPPFEALLFWPLAKLSYVAAYGVWTAANFGLLFGIAILLRREVVWLQGGATWLWWLAALAFFPVGVTLVQGQDTLWLLLFFVLAYRALRREAEFAAGCWLGLGLFRPQFVLPFVLLMALQRRWKFVEGFGMVGIALGLISVATVGWSATRGYPEFVLSVDRSATGVTAPWGMPNLHGLVATIGSRLGISGEWVVVLTATLSVGMLVAAIRRAARGSGDRFDLRFSLAVLVAVLVSYHALEHDLTLLLLPCVLVANFVAGRELRLVNRAGLVAPMLALFFTPLYVWLSFQVRQTALLTFVLLIWAAALMREMRPIRVRENSVVARWE